LVGALLTAADHRCGAGVAVPGVRGRPAETGYQVLTRAGRGPAIDPAVPAGVAGRVGAVPAELDVGRRVPGRQLRRARRATTC
jgi:hypothetical protein